MTPISSCLFYVLNHSNLYSLKFEYTILNENRFVHLIRWSSNIQIMVYVLKILLLELNTKEFYTLT